MKILVVNCSAPHYNLGAAKLRDWLRSDGHEVDTSEGDNGFFAYGYDCVCLSVIFSWHAPVARDIALRVKDESEVWCGGPGMFALRNWWKEQTGLTAHGGIDERFEHQRGEYRMTFASRGCPVGCYFCIVPKLEGKEFTLNYDFQPAPVLCDNNLSALPEEFQEHIIRRYQETGTRLEDANSGFEPRTFNEKTYRRWFLLMRSAKCWRFAYDDMGETEEVKRMMHILKEEKPSRKRVYVLVGNEPFDACNERAQKVIEWGGEPHCQYVLPLHWLGNPATLNPRYDWTYQKGRDFCRYYNRFLWRTIPISDYRPRKHFSELERLVPRASP